MPRLATVLAAGAVALGAGLIGLSAGGMAGVGGELRAAAAMQESVRSLQVSEHHRCPRPARRGFDSRQL